MAAKSNPRKWSDIQTVIAAVSIVTTLGLWNLFATPVQKSNTDQPPVDTDLTPIPYVKITFATQVAPQPANSQPQTKKKNKHKNNGGNNTTVATTKTS